MGRPLGASRVTGARSGQARIEKSRRYAMCALVRRLL